MRWTLAEKVSIKFFKLATAITPKLQQEIVSRMEDSVQNALGRCWDELDQDVDGRRYAYGLGRLRALPDPHLHFQHEPFVNRPSTTATYTNVSQGQN